MAGFLHDLAPRSGDRAFIPLELSPRQYPKFIFRALYDSDPKARSVAHHNAARRMYGLACHFRPIRPAVSFSKIAIAHAEKCALLILPVGNYRSAARAPVINLSFDPLQRDLPELAQQRHSSIIMTAAMTATITTAITARCIGLEIMCRRIANRVPSGTSAMPHFGHGPDPDWRTALCIGQV